MYLKYGKFSVQFKFPAGQMGHMGEDWMEGDDDNSILKEIEETSGPVSR